MNVFLSHNHLDKYRVRELANRLRAAEFTVWLDEESIKPGDAWVDKIQQAIDHADAIVVVVSRHTSSSQWQSSEIAHAIAARRYHQKKVIPVLIDKGAELPFFLRDILYCDLSSKEAFDRNFGSLLTALSDKAQKTEKEEVEAEQRKFESINIEREFLHQEAKQIEQKRAIWNSTLLGAFSSIVAAFVVSITIFGSKIDAFFPLIKDSLPFVAGVLFGVISTLFSAVITRYFQKRMSKKEARHER